MGYHQKLRDIAQSTDWLMSALFAVRELELKSWCIGAGAIRNLVWDYLHGYRSPLKLSDIDVAYFEPLQLCKFEPLQLCKAGERDKELQSHLTSRLPGVQWELTNQAAVHLWYENYCGVYQVPFESLEEGIASWPEYATCVGLRLEADNSLTVIAPHGLEDLFELRLRCNPSCADKSAFEQRLRQKRFEQHWPLLQIKRP